jgi:hypothetical protein
MGTVKEIFGKITSSMKKCWIRILRKIFILEYFPSDQGGCATFKGIFFGPNPSGSPSLVRKGRVGT